MSNSNPVVPSLPVGAVRLWGGDRDWVESIPSPYGEGYHPYIALPLAAFHEQAAKAARCEKAEALLTRIGEIVAEGDGFVGISLTENGGIGCWLPEDGYPDDGESATVPEGETVEEAIRFRLDKLDAQRKGRAT